MKPVLIILFGGIALVAVAFIPTLKPKESKPQPTVSPASIRSVADIVIKAIASKDWGTVASYSSAAVRFSPYGYIDTKNHLTLTQDIIKNFPLISAAYTWGNYDGSGEPIVLGTGAYYEKFIYDKDYANATQVIENRTDSRGNTINNLKEVYPNAQWVEYYLQGSEQYNGMDWGSLILVFDQQNGQWKLVGIVHDQWTI